MVQGEPGLDCVVIVDGTFEVTAKGRRQRLASRGTPSASWRSSPTSRATATVTALTSGEVLRIEPIPSSSP